MLQVDFPIMGPMRKYLILMEWIIVFVCFELSVIFLIRYYHSKKKSKNIQELSYAGLIFSYSLNWTFYIISDFYMPTSELRMIYLNFGYFALMGGALLFIFIMERNIIIFRKNFFTIIFVILTILFFLVLIIDINYTQLFSAIPWPFFVIFFIFYFYDLAKKAPEDTNKGIVFLKFFSGFLLLGIGYVLTIDAVTNVFGLMARFYGDMVQILAMTVLYLFFTTLPPLSEFNWHDKIESVYLINKSGIPLFVKTFGVEKSAGYEVVVPGALTSIQMMLKEITKTEGISVIKKANSITIIVPRDLIIGVIITKEDLNSLKILLQKFVKKVETVYQNILPHWRNDQAILKPIESIYNSIFQ
ncbi:MAG: hypothetical protein EU533_03025 [Promethearchaeota archaeon]|nr:MAG: hypothetical protein EU533_03025 [Candidatus Lokiarchaeota archaeon]